jgi:hypothetical protein
MKGETMFDKMSARCTALSIDVDEALARMAEAVEELASFAEASVRSCQPSGQ